MPDPVLRGDLDVHISDGPLPLPEGERPELNVRILGEEPTGNRFARIDPGALKLEEVLTTFGMGGKIHISGVDNRLLVRANLTVGLGPTLVKAEFKGLFPSLLSALTEIGEAVIEERAVEDVAGAVDLTMPLHQLLMEGASITVEGAGKDISCTLSRGVPDRTFHHRGELLKIRRQAHRTGRGPTILEAVDAAVNAPFERIFEMIAG